MKRILIIKFWALGDILMATPLLAALKKQYPDCHITWLADSGYAGILQGNPVLDDIISFDAGTWRRHYRYGRWISYARMTRNLRRDLVSQNFDIVVNLMAEKWWSLWLLAAPNKIGLFSGHPGLLGRFYTQAIPRNRAERLHNTRHTLRAADALDIPGPHSERMVLGIRDEDREAVQVFLRGQPNYDSRKPLIVLHPGTSQSSKCWLPEHYAAVASELSHRCTVVLTGSAKERALAETIAALMPPDINPPIIAAGELPHIGQTVALIAQARAVVTGDTSVLHIASALDTPLVAVYGSTRPGDNAPLFGRNLLLYDDTVPCAPCYKAACPLAGGDHLRCQRAVTPAQVLNALDALLEETHEPSSIA